MFLKKGTYVTRQQFTEFKKDGEDDQTYYCNDWLYTYLYQRLIIVGTSLVVVSINVVASMVLQYSVHLEKRETYNQEAFTQFKKLLLLQFFNIGMIVLIINFDFTPKDQDGQNKLFLGFLPIFNGEFEDFNSAWYSKVGKTLCLTLLINIFTPHISKLSLPLLKIVQRFWDRGCSCTIWKKVERKGDKNVNTKKLLQLELNELYTGAQIPIYYVYAQIYTYLCVVLMYSTGLPILYPFAAIFYCVLYWVYKFLLLKYYARTTVFDKQIPIESIKWFQLGIGMHFLIGSIMLSN